MNAAQTAREALVLEALGDIAGLLDRVDALAAQLSATGDKVTQASERLQSQAAAMEPRMAQLAEHAQGVAAKHIARSTREILHSAAESERHSMAAFASALFHSELYPTLHSLQQAATACAERRGGLQVYGWACAASALASAILSSALTLYFMG
ncbi:hypothetical protein LC605_23070 [Nostoc sp. CHAB 5836]|nr:hypothetical protein [Nostoc sp. CHAB 5836]